jgi:hypothetical protein
LRYGGLKVADAREGEVLRSLAGIVVRYGKKMEGAPMEAEVIIDRGDTVTSGMFGPLAEAVCQQWRM